MNIKNIFPKPIGHFNDKEFTDQVLPIAKEILKTTAICSLGYKSTYGDIEKLNKVKSYSFIEDKIKKVTNEFFEKIEFVPTGELEISTFITKMKKGDFHLPHVHPNSILSGTYYLQVAPNSSPIMFDDFRTIRNFNGLTPTRMELMRNSFYPKAGDCVMFESWVPHSVPQNQSESRITLIFDVHLKLYQKNKT